MMYAPLTGTVNGSSSQSGTPTPDAPICIVSDVYYRKSYNIYDGSITAVESISELANVPTGKAIPSKANVASYSPIGSAMTFAVRCKGLIMRVSQDDTFSWKYFGTITTSRVYLCEVDEDGNTLMISESWDGSTSKTYTVQNSDCAFLCVEWSIDETDNAQMMFVSGATIPTEYEQYGAYYPVELRSVGSDSSEVTDIYAYDTEDEEWQIARNVFTHVFDGTETFVSSGVLDNMWAWDTPVDSDTSFTDRTCMCNYLATQSTLPISEQRQGKCVLGKVTSSSSSRSAGKYIGLGLLTAYPTLAEVQAYLAGLYAQGTPLIVQTYTNAPTTETVTLYKFTRGFRAVKDNVKYEAVQTIDNKTVKFRAVI